MAQVEFVARWNRTTGHGQMPLAQVHDDNWLKPEPELATHIEKQRVRTAGRQAIFLEDTRRQAELDLARLGCAEWLLTRGVEVSAHHVNSLYVWADECSEFCHPKAIPHIHAMVEPGANVLSRLPMASFIQNIRRYGLG